MAFMALMLVNCSQNRTADYESSSADDTEMNDPAMQTSANWEDERRELRKDLEKVSDKIDKQIEKIEEKTADAPADVQQQWNETLASLREKRMELDQDIAQLDNSTEDNWDSFKADVEQSWDNFEAEVDRIGDQVADSFDDAEDNLDDNN